MPKTQSFVQSKFQVSNRRTSDSLPVRVITIESDAQPGSIEFELAVNAAVVAAKIAEQKELESLGGT